MKTSTSRNIIALLVVVCTIALAFYFTEQIQTTKKPEDVTLPSSLTEIEISTPEEAKALALKAAEYVRMYGQERAAEEFRKQNSEFVKGDLYVFALNREGVFLANPRKPAMEGANSLDITDAIGTHFVRNFLKIEGEGWSEYVWPHPITKRIHGKKSYIIDVDGLVIGVGVYYDE